MATDRANANVSGKKSFLTKWEEYTQRWKDFAQSQGREIEFEFWGSFELSDLLSKPENAGKNSFGLTKANYLTNGLNNTINKPLIILVCVIHLKLMLIYLLQCN